MSRWPVPAGQRGAALLLVMWLVLLLTALVGAFALSARIEQLQARVLVHGVTGEQAARAGLEYALQRVRDPDPLMAWVPDGRGYDWQFAGMQIEIRVRDESGRVDLNAADQSLLAALMTGLGSDQAEAVRLAAAIVDWRDPDDLVQPAGGAEDPQYAAAGLPWGAKDAPFESVSELGLVLGMPPALAERMAAHVTVHSGLAMPDARFAGAVVLRAMGHDPDLVQEPVFVGSGTGTYSIDSRAHLADGRQARLRAVVRAGGGSQPGMAHVPLSWKEGAWAPDDD